MKIELPHDPLIDTGNGDALVVLPDPLGNLAMWNTFVNTFGKTHRILVPRLPFYIYPLNLCRANNIATYLEKFLNAHGITRPVIIGEGIASFIALMYAWLSPKKVKRLVLTGSPELDKSPFDVSSPVFHDDFANNFAESSLKPKWVETDYLTAYEESGDAKFGGTVIPSLTQIATPVLLISGVQDKITPPEVSLEFHDLLPCSKVVFIDECGHRPMFDQPHVFHGHVRNFLS